MAPRLPPPPLLLMLLVLLLVFATAHRSSDRYTTVLSKSNGEKLRPGPRFYLNDMQCLAYIPPSYLCSAGRLLGVEVRMTDLVAFPMLQVEDSLVNVSLARRPNAFGVCHERAPVETRVRCSRWDFAVSRIPRPLPDKSSGGTS